MRLNGCPSLTLRESPDPLREDPIAHVDETCVGCGVCGEVAHAAVLCPSFYERGGHHQPQPVDALAVAPAGRRHRPPRHVLARGVAVGARWRPTRPSSPSLIPAVGGQGGGVLSEWIVDAALARRAVACTAPRFPAWPSAPAPPRTTSSSTPRRDAEEPRLLALSGARRPRRAGRAGVPRGGAHDRAGLRLAAAHDRDRLDAPPLLDPREDRDRPRHLSAGGAAARGRGRRAAPGGVRRAGPGARARHRGQRGPARRAGGAAGRCRCADAAFRGAIERKGVAGEVEPRRLRARPRAGASTRRTHGSAHAATLDEHAGLSASARACRRISGRSSRRCPSPSATVVTPACTSSSTIRTRAMRTAISRCCGPSCRRRRGRGEVEIGRGGGAVPGAVDELRGCGAGGGSEDAGDAVRAHPGVARGPATAPSS